jgi:DNA polymerase
MGDKIEPGHIINDAGNELQTLTAALLDHMEDSLAMGDYGTRFWAATKIKPPEALVLPPEDKGKATGASRNLADIRRMMGDCQRCPLFRGRKNIVFGEGNPNAKLVFVGEGPGEDEDLTGRPFVGRAGQLLTRIIEAMGLTRKDVYICNVVKCRPPGNRAPEEEEMLACEPFLKEQLALINPQVICALGAVATRRLLSTKAPITALRGHFASYEGIDLMPTYHPAYLLRNPQAKKPVWEDMQKIMRLMKLPIKSLEKTIER